MSWSTVSLGEAVAFRGGGTPSRGNPSYWGGSIPWATVKDLNSGYALRTTQEFITEEGLQRSASNLIPAGTVIIPTRMALGKAVMSEVDVAINQDLKAAIPIKELDTRFLLWFFLANSSRIEAMGKGATVKGVTLDQLRSLEIPLPPIAEQRRIAAILDNADALRAKRREAIAKLDQLLQSVFLDMFGDPVTNPGNWPVVQFGSVTESRLGKMLDEKTRIGEYMRPYLANINVQWGRFELDNLRQMNFPPDDQEKFALRYGDLLMCEGGEPGRCAVWKEQFPGCYYQKALHRIRCNPQKCVPEFVQWLFWFLAQAGAFKSSIAVATIAHLPGIKLRSLKVPLPPLALQQKFSNQAKSIEQQKELLQRSFGQIDTLFATVQHRAFSGTL